MKHKISIKQLKKNSGTIVYHITMCLVSLVMLYPLLWMISASLKEEHLIITTATKLIPDKITFENYIKGWQGTGKITYTTYFKNTIFLTVTQTIGATVSAALVAYGFARINFRFRSFWFAIMIGTMCLPAIVLRIPRYLLFNELGWVGTYLPIILPNFFGEAYNIFMIMQFMKGIPRELDESAKIDGCGWFQLFTKIMLPLVRPAVVMVAVMAFMSFWGEFYAPLIYLNDPAKYPVALAIKMFADVTGDISYGSLLAMSTLSLIPILILFLIFQKSLIEGIATSGIKG